MIPVLLLTLAGAGAIGAIALAVRRSGQQRTEELRLEATRRGWGFRDVVPFDAIPNLDRFELFRQGRARKLRNVMTSPPDQLRVVIFDYSYTTGGGKSQQTHNQTVFYATSDHLHLPIFSLRPEHFFHRIGTLLGYQDIDLEERPEFSRLFLLRGEDPDAIREAFGVGVAEYLERRAGCCAAGAGRELLYWRPGKRVPPHELSVLIEEGRELAFRFTS